MIHEVSQGSIEWHTLRLGKITSTTVAALMTNSRKKDELSSTAKAELYRIRSERRLLPNIKENPLPYIERISFSNKAMEYGRELEQEARDMYELTVSPTEVSRVGFVTSDETPDWGDSPDGLIGSETYYGVIEIKCPKPATWQEYHDRLIINKESLKEVKPEYYWQCLNHIAVNKAEYCDFVFYDNMLQNGFEFIRLLANDVQDDINEMKTRVNNFLKLVKT